METTALPATSPRTLPVMAGKIDRERHARLELRMTEEEKALLERAAKLGGEDTSQFVRRVALMEARLLESKLAK